MEGKLALILSASIALLFHAEVVNATTCYYPDGSIARDFQYQPCGNGTAACCIPSEGDICLPSSGLCYWPIQPGDSSHGNYIYRGACTDQSWGSSGCAHYCTSKPDYYESLVFCNATQNFCCQKGVVNGSCCDTPTSLFMPPGLPSEILVALEGGPAVSTGTGGTLPSSTGGAVASSSTASSSGSGSSKAEIIGPVVGGVAFIALGVLAWCFRRQLFGRDRPLTTTFFGRFGSSGRSTIFGRQPNSDIGSSLRSAPTNTDKQLRDIGDIDIEKEVREMKQEGDTGKMLATDVAVLKQSSLAEVGENSVRELADDQRSWRSRLQRTFARPQLLTEDERQQQQVAEAGTSTPAAVSPVLDRVTSGLSVVSRAEAREDGKGSRRMERRRSSAEF